MTEPFFPGAVAPTTADLYTFDLTGFLVVRQALSADEVGACNEVLDRLQHLPVGAWDGWVHGHTYGARDGRNLQQIYEAGPAFERLLDHPAYIERVRTFVGGEGTFDYHHGPLFIDECFANLRGPGESIPMHSGGREASKRTQFLVKDGRFWCGQINVLIALTDIGPGDGATMVVPGSHKANFPHPDLERAGWGHALAMDGVAHAVEVHLRAGDCLLFVDAICHGSSARRNPGQRRIGLYRYGPSWGATRHGYQPSPELLQRLTPSRRRLVQPLAPVLPPRVEALAL